MIKKNQPVTTVVKNPGFLNLWLNQILIQLAYNSLNFALIIWVFHLTSSNTAVSALMFSISLPAVILGVFPGILVDVTDRRVIIRFINLCLTLSFLALIILKSNYFGVLFMAFFVNALAQFYVPAESSAIPIVVKKEQLLSANSLFSITLFAAFLFGFGLAGPMIANFGIDLVFVIQSLLALAAFLLTFLFPPIKSNPDKESRQLLVAIEKRKFAQVKSIGLGEVRKTLDIIRGKFSLAAAILIISSVQVVIGVLAVLLPAFFEHALKINVTDASLIMILPLGAGMILGSTLLARFGSRVPKRAIVSRAIILAGVMFLMISIAPVISPVIQYFRKTPLPFFYQLPLSSILAFCSFVMGIAMVSIVVPTQTAIQETVSEASRGKIYAVLGAVMSTLTLLPVLFAGILADTFGTLPIFLFLGVIVIAAGFVGLRPSLFFKENHLPYSLRQFLGLGHWKKVT